MSRSSASALPALLAVVIVGLFSGATVFTSSPSTRSVSLRGKPAHWHGVPMRYTVTLDTPDGVKTFECAEDEYILDRAEEEGLDVPYACRAGTCASCVGQVVDGSVDQSEQIFLTDEQVEAGYCTTCVSKPTSDVRIRTHVEREIYDAISSQAPSVNPRDTIGDHAGSAASTGIRFRQNFGEVAEHLLNQQVQMELQASHFYQAMGAYFDRADVALPGFKDWSVKQSEEEREHAEKFIEYINLRGGRYTPLNIGKPDHYEFSSALDAMEAALKLEITVNKHLLNLHKAASNADDAQLCDLLESEFLTEQVESINGIAKTIRQLARVGPGLGEYTIDKDMA